MLKNGKSRTYRKTGKKAIHRRKTVDKNMSKVNHLRKLVKMEIAKNVENKITGNQQASNSVVLCPTSNTGTITSIGDLSYFVFNPVDAGVLNVPQGTDVQSRIGNQIKLKRYVIKGSVYWDPTLDASNNFININQGYVDLYVGRLLNNEFIDTHLTDLYNNGSTALFPTMQILDRTLSINKDQYKTYWHKRFKIGQSSANYNNNDYKLNVEFGLDVCRYVCKNKIIKYDDVDATPNDSLLSSITLFAVGTYPNADFNPGTGGYNPDSFAYFPVRIQCTSYCEYEDA